MPSPRVATFSWTSGLVSEHFVFDSAYALGCRPEDVYFLRGDDRFDSSLTSCFAMSRQRAHMSAIFPGRILTDVISRYDVISAHFAVTGFTLRKACAAEGKPLVTTVHGADLLTGRPVIGNALAKMRSRSLSQGLLAVPSAYLAGRLLTQFGLKANVVGNVIDVEQIRRTADAFTGSSPAKWLAPAALHVVFAGRLVPKKDPLTAIRATGIAQQVADIELCIVGDGPLAPECRSEAERLSNVRFLGSLPHHEFVSFLATADLIILPSVSAANGDAETFGVVIGEAAALEIPALASDHGGLPEVVVNGVTGLLCPPGDENAFARGLVRMAREPHTRAQMGTAAKQHIKQFAPEHYRERFMQIAQRPG